MKIRRRRLLRMAGIALAAPAVLRATRGNAAEVTFRLHHFLPPVSNAHKLLLVPWADQVSVASDGRIKIQIFPSMQLGGAPPQLYDQARDGIADIVWTLPGNTPGRFPRIEVFELPFVPARKAIANAQAVQEYATTQAKEDFKEVHLITAWAHDRGVIHSKRQVTTMADLSGLKLRFPTRYAGEALRALGASPIGMPIPQVPEAMAQGVIEGCVVPWEVVPAIKVQELVTHHTEIPGSPTLYTATFVLAMNPAKYEALPDDLRQVLDAHSGMTLAKMAGEVWDQAAIPAEQATRERGNEIVTISEEEAARWRETTRPVVDAWVTQAGSQGLDGAQLLEAARGLIQKYEQA
jgi:TRAP-type transport system periplasmic protein